MKLRHAFTAGVMSLCVGACAGNAPIPKDYTAFRKAAPRSILIVPVVNHSNEAQAADLFLTTLAVPLSERGYYVFPTAMTKKLIQDDGLSDPGAVHSASTPALASLFGADAVLYVEILDWKARYAVTASTVTVKFLYTLKNGRTGDLLWQDEQGYTYSTSSNSGNILADLVANAVTSMINNGRADYTPVAVQANALALLPVGQGIPFGPYARITGQDDKAFPSTGSGKVSNASTPAISYPVAPVGK